MRWSVVAVVAVVIAAGAWTDRRSWAGRGPRRPSADAEVLARVPARALDPGATDRARLRRRLRGDARDIEAATELARMEIEAARRSGDPRFLDHAEAALATWWDAERPPRTVLLLRATIRQARHEFDAALADLDGLLDGASGGPDPLAEQTWLTRAVVLGVLGRYPEALSSCDRLRDRASDFVVAACRAPLLGVTGHARDGASALAGALAAAASPEEQAWGLSLLGELMRWMGDDDQAERLLRASLARRPDDVYTRGVLAELLRDTGRGPEARALAGPVDQPARLELAREHWRVQREPADARVLLEAAAVAGDRTAAAPVLAWLAETGFEWPRLRRLAARLGGTP